MDRKVPFNKKQVPLKHKSWIFRNQRLFVGLTTTAALLMLFSKPIYDIFVSDEQLPDLNDLLRERELEREKRFKRH